MELRPYQTKLVDTSIQMLIGGKRKIVCQLATGGGKTVCFAAISASFTRHNTGKSVLILVHRKELLQQTRRTLYDAFSLVAQPIAAGMRHIPSAPVYVGMVESVNRRMEQIRNVGLVIIDEAHIGAFNKLHQHFPDQYIIGFTATPQSASKKDPMRNHYEDIVCGVDIPELIAAGNLCQNITYAPKDIVDRSELQVKGGEFAEGEMGKVFSRAKHVNNTVSAYQRWAAGVKTIIFNCSVSHSQAVCTAFQAAGYNCRHLDGAMSGTERDNIMKWLKHTPDAILCNVGVATTGFDEPTIEAVIMNRATMSMPLWLQCAGRGSRPTSAKSAFTIIDMGGNAVAHGDWCDQRDWADIFHNPPKARQKDAVAPVKNCPECDAIIAAAARVCKVCGYAFPAAVSPEEQVMGDFIVVTRGIDVRDVIQRHRDKKMYFSFYEIPRTLAQIALGKVEKIQHDYLEGMRKELHRLCADWCEANHRNYNDWHKEQAVDSLYKELKKAFPRWKIPTAPAPTEATPSVAWTQQPIGPADRAPKFNDFFANQIQPFAL